MFGGMRKTALGRNPILGPVLIIPAVVGVALFQFLPLIVAFLNSFRSFNPFTQAARGWVGLRNYMHVFADPTFGTALLNTVFYIALMLAITIPLALGLAVLFDRRLPGTTWARAAVIAALAASEAATALVWNRMYEPSTGLFNTLLSAIGAPTQPFLTDSSQALVCIVILIVWKDVGLPMLIFLGGLQAVPDDLREAAALDGASPMRTFWSIVLPLLKPSLVLALFITTITATRIFTPIQILTQGGPAGSTANLAYYSYAENFLFTSPGLASVSVVVMLLLLAVITYVQSRIIRDVREQTR